MARIQCDFFSNSLMMNTSVTVILPTIDREEQSVLTSRFQEGKKFQTLLLLHGMFGDHTDWSRSTQIETYAEENTLAVVMPSAENSFYTDMKIGGKYWTYVSEELPRACRAMFPLSDKREDNFVAGLSMGGYGAFKLALRKPENFAAAASLSGVMDISGLVNDPDVSKELIAAIYGGVDQLKTEENDLYLLAKINALKKSAAPMLYQACGTEDSLYQDNIAFRDYLESLGLVHAYEEGPGVHDYYFWNAYIKKAIEWMPLKRTAV
ncbi:MAG TPA: alpha/beta hydrolase family protein [Clostridia bacterium]|nr:alpha/beta hydrolase family protein [Clostridia bacterium]